jgi:protein-tyrosine sulfotransferase
VSSADEPAARLDSAGVETARGPYRSGSRGGELGSPILVFGISPRSGTHYLYDALLLHDEVVGAMPAAHDEAQPSWEDHLLSDADQLIGYVNRVQGRWNIDDAHRTAAGAALARSLGDGLGEFLGELAWSGGARAGQRPLSKTPGLENLDLIDELIPSASLVVVIRDPRAVVASSLASFGNSPERWIRVWQRNGRILLTFMRRHPDRVAVVRYEELFRHPSAVVAGLLERLELGAGGYDFEALRSVPVRGTSQLLAQLGWTPVQSPAEFDPLARGRELSGRVNARLEWLLRDEMNALGYEPAAAPGKVAATRQRVLDARWALAHEGTRTKRAFAVGIAEFRRDRTRVIENAGPSTHGAGDRAARLATHGAGAGLIFGTGPEGHSGDVPQLPATARHTLSFDATARRLALLCMALTAVIGVIDAADTHLDLIGLLVVGPCLATLARKVRATALVSVWTTGLAILLGGPDGIWGTHRQIAYAGSVALVSGLSTAASAVIAGQPAGDS